MGEDFNEHVGKERSGYEMVYESMDLEIEMKLV